MLLLGIRPLAFVFLPALSRAEEGLWQGLDP
jgi:hypothetical protein